MKKKTDSGFFSKRADESDLSYDTDDTDGVGSSSLSSMVFTPILNHRSDPSDPSNPFREDVDLRRFSKTTDELSLESIKKIRPMIRPTRHIHLGGYYDG